MVLLPQCPIHEGPEVGSQRPHQVVYTERTNPVSEEEVFDNTADDVRLVPVHPTPIFQRFGSGVVEEDEAGSAASDRISREVA